MCLLIFAHRTDARRPLVVAANRDEFHHRRTAPSRFWPECPDLLAGRDLEQGGTWMGITRGGRFAAVTNYRDPARTAPAPRSRGELPLGFLRERCTPEAFLEDLRGRADDYAGFNLLVGDGDGLWYFTNSTPVAQRDALQLEPGIYGLSNARLDTPWPKVELGRQRLRSLFESGGMSHDALAAVVGDRRMAPPQALHRQGLGSDMDQLLSAQFIVTSSYGTRSSTSLWLDEQARVHWRETSYDAAGLVTGQCEESFGLN